MACVRGSSPSTEKALSLGAPVKSAGCQAMLRNIPVAAVALIERGISGQHDSTLLRLRGAVEDWARESRPAHPHTVLAAQKYSVLRDSGVDRGSHRERRPEVGDQARDDDLEYPVSGDIGGALSAGFKAPSRTSDPRATGAKDLMAALTGGLYVALSFPDEDTISEALEFAGWAPDRHSSRGGRRCHTRRPTRLRSTPR